MTGAEEMAAIMAFIYVHTHLHRSVSGAESNQGDTFLLRDVIGACAHKTAHRSPTTVTAVQAAAPVRMRFRQLTTLEVSS